MDLRLISNNCRGLPGDKRSLDLRPDIIMVMKDAHIVALQETWLSKQNLNRINSLHNDFVGHGVAIIMC